jgi:hypothetical protein
MSKAEDITNLFRRFGGDAGTYQEIVEHDQADAAQRAWPMLGHIQPQQHQEAPAARAGGVAGAVRQRQAPEPVRPVAVKPPLRVASLAEVAQPLVRGDAPAAEPVVPATTVPLPAVTQPVQAVVPAFVPLPASLPDEVKVAPAPVAPVPVAPSAAQPPAAPAAAVRVVAEPAVVPQSAEPRTELKQMFDRMAKAAMRSTETDQASSPLKRLIKW